MIIFNRNEEENSFKTVDNEILQIESRLSLRDFTQKLQDMLAGRECDLSAADYELHLFRAGVHRNIAFVTDDTVGFDRSLYNHTFDAESERGLDEMERKRPALYEDFERFTYGQNYDFVEVPVQHDFASHMDNPANEVTLRALYRDCLDALGVMPTLYDNLDVPVKQLQDMSYMGQGFYWAWESFSDANRMPTAADLQLIFAMTPYERAVITDSNFNPTHLLNLIQALKASPGMKDFAVSKELIEEMIALCEDGLSDEEITTQIISARQENFYAAGASYGALKDAFVSAYRRAPRILPEIFQAALLTNGHPDNASLTAEEIADVVAGFKLTNIQKVAGMHSLALLQLSPYMNYDTVKKEHLQIFATYLPSRDFQMVKDSGFLEWYDARKSEVKTSDLLNIVRNISNLHFDISLSPKELLRLAGQVRGWCNAACVNQQYGIDFRNAIVAIPGRGLVVEDRSQHIRMYILDRDDARVFTVGQDCHCCQNLAVRGDQTYGEYYAGDIMKDLMEQHFTNIDDAYAYVAQHYADNRSLITPGAGGSCVANELTNPLAWVTIWEDTNTGATIAQADTHYIPDGNGLVYDNIEFVNDGNVKKLYDIIAIYAEHSDFDSIHVGTGYNQGMKAFGKRIATKEMFHYTDDITDEFQKFGTHLYSDYHSDAVKIKQDGEMLIFSKKPETAFHIEHRPEDNEQFRFFLHPLCALFPSYTIPEKQQLLERYESQNLTEEELLVAAKRNPELLGNYEILPLAVQRAILFVTTPRSGTNLVAENFKYIRHPDSLLIQEAIQDRPSNIIYFDSENTNRDIWLGVLRSDGSLIEYCPDDFLDEELITEAIKNNPFSIKYVAKKLEEPLRSQMIRMAIFKKPILSAHFPDLPEYVWVSICERRGQFGKYCPNQTYRVQKAMIQSSPYNIDNIRTPDVRIVNQVAVILPDIRNNPRYSRYFQNESQPNHRSNRIERTQAAMRPAVASPATTADHSYAAVEEEFNFDMLA